MKKMNKELFILEANKKHDFKYDYSKVNYINTKTKVCITCPIHGDFWQEPYSHLRGCGCSKCADLKRGEEHALSSEEFIERATLKHATRYDYSKVKYVNSKTKVCIICPIHGEFWQLPHEHLRGRGCKKCGDISVGKKNKKITTDEFIRRAKLIHGGFYDYSKTEYISARKKVCIIDSEFGEFWMMPYAHLNGQGCPARRFDRIREKKLKTLDEFKNDALLVHGNRYCYDKVEYSGVFNKVCIICPTHGEFWQRPSDHLCGSGCPICKISHLENEVKIWLDENNVEYEYQYKNKIFGNQSLDFYLPKKKIAIECQGEQHFFPIDYFGGKETFKKVIKLDSIKRKICENNGILLLYYIKDKKFQTNSTNEVHNISDLTRVLQ